MKSNKDLENIRHSLAHLLAATVLDMYPGTKNTLGPAIENGFYYDFDIKGKISEDDLPKIEKKMRDILKSWKDFKEIKTTVNSAKSLYEDNEYKIELIDEIVSTGEKLTLYKSGDFTDLCRGGHVAKIKDIKPDAFALTKVAGAYWRGDEKNKMLTRVYGVAFKNKKDLDKHLAMLEVAKARDHKKLGQELDLFTFSPLVGSGLPLFTPKGTFIRNMLDERVWKLREKYGYERVDIPHLTKMSLYKKSGHADKFADELFKVKTREGHTYALKPMNCPHHIEVFKRKQWSYKEMPVRYASTTKVYRDEQSGELNGLSRVLSITQDDAHVFCKYDQVKEEANNIWKIVNEFYKPLGFEITARLSLHDPEQMDKYLGDEKIWKKAEDELRAIAKANKAKAEEAVGEAALYGPKIDFIGKDSLGRILQVATIQLDMNLPERFELSCINKKGEKEPIVILHAAIMGSIERFLAGYIEHTAGNFPFWLSPEQVRVIPISENHRTVGKKIHKTLHDAGFRVEIDLHDESLGKKIRSAKKQKIPYIVVIGDKEVKSKKFTLESREKGNLGAMSETALLKLFEKENQ